MASGKNSFLLYIDLIHTVNKMSDEKAGQLFKTILAYVNDQDPVIDDLLIEIAFEPIRQSLKRDLKKWEGELENKSIGGRVGNLKRWNIDLYNRFSKKEITLEEAESIALLRKTPLIDTDINNQIPSDTDTEHRIPSDTIASIAVNDTVNDTVSVSVIVSEKKKDIYPTIEEAEIYFKEKGSSKIESDKFFYFYESNGWKVGKNPMKNWKSAASGWLSRSGFVSPQVAKTKNNDLEAYEQRMKELNQPI